MNVLIVDDKEDNRYLLEVLLRGNGHTVLVAANGAEALEQVKSGGVELIISDILMPVMDGFELCRKVRANEALRHIPVIIYTATYTGAQDEALARRIGADRFILKPCEPDIFMEAVREVAAGATHRDAEMTPHPHEEEVLKLYNERLVRKLEQKMIELEKEVEIRQQAEATRRQSQEKYKSILDNIEDGYFEVDTAGNLQFFNPALARILGYSSDELMGMNYRQFTDAENQRKVFQTFHRVFATGEPARATGWEMICKDGKRRYADTSVTLIRDDEGKAAGFRGVVQDITEQKIAEREKQKLQEQLHQAQKMETLGRLAGGVAHDFNNLLSIILGYGELVRDALGKNHPHHEMLAQIHEAGTRARSLTRQLLAFSRKQVLETRVVDINQVVAGFEKLLGRLIGENIRLQLAMNPAPLMVKADVTQMEQVLMNLAVNARDAMPDGGALTIETTRTELDEAGAARVPGLMPGGYALIHVRDTGTGMDEKTLDRIFEPFFTTKENDKGTGLGLATSYGIIKQHQGNIRAFSAAGEGTTFQIHLPLVAPSERPGGQCDGD